MTCIHSVFILQEANQSLSEQGKKVGVVYIDVRKAFYSVSHERLRVKMHQKGVRVTVWQIINKK